MDELDLIAIIDDEEDSAEQSKYVVEDLNCEMLVITDGHYNSVDQLVNKIKHESQGRKFGVLCDHRLTHGAFANFYGSALVAQLYKLSIPAILLTQFSSIDVDTTIRQHRRWLPSMIARDKLTIDSIPEGLHFCLDEINGRFSEDRVPRRTLVEVIGASIDGNIEVAEAFIPGWNPGRAIRFPLELMDETSRELTVSKLRVREYAYLFAEVNIGAKDQADLFLTNFEWRNEPQSSPIDNWMSQIQ